MTELPFTIENCQVGKLVKYCHYKHCFFKQNKKEINIDDIGLIIAINKEKNTVSIRWFGFNFPYDFNKNTISRYYIKDISCIINLFITIIQQ